MNPPERGKARGVERGVSMRANQGNQRQASRTQAGCIIQNRHHKHLQQMPESPSMFGEVCAIHHERK